MSGASGKVPSAIHLTPEAADGGPISKIQDGDIIRLDTIAGTLEVKMDDATLSTRPCATSETLEAHHSGLGRELFAMFRDRVGAADAGASVF
jgi:phosphogluconate dehydratase